MGEITDLRNLPAPVLERLSQLDTRDLAEANIEVVQRGRRLEARPMRGAELRVDEDGNPVLEGYATVYDFPYEVAGGPPWGWVEIIVAGAADKTVRERDDVRLLVNHDGIPLARTRSKTLELVSDKTGVRAGATLDGASPIVAGLRSAMAREDMDEMSMAFRALRQEWNEDYTERRIVELKLFDVSVVTFPANPATVAQLRTDDEPAETRTGLSLTFARALREQHRTRRAA